MLRAWSASGRPAHLLAYTHGAYPLETPYVVHRVPDFPRVRSLRSGPTWGKIALDARGVAATRTLARRLRPTAIIAHHIEAAIVTLAANVAPVYYVAHTSLSRELPVYVPGLPRTAVSAIGDAAERWVCRRAAGVAAVAPSLARLLPKARHVPVPWPSRFDRPPKSVARAALRLPDDARVCLYAGNLDRYQGWEHLLDAIAQLRRVDEDARLLIATESNVAPVRSAARVLGIADAVDFRRLSSERARMHVHAAADVAWVPRRTEGGLPIKMLDAFARQVPVVAMERATAGLAVHGACTVVLNDEPSAIVAATMRLFDDPTEAQASCSRASSYLADRHSTGAYVDAIRGWIDEEATTRAGAKQTVQRRQAAPELRAR
jgi:glycosyltransferase involved in cell wall biosynthesis